jgi:hypothetical protein
VLAVLPPLGQAQKKDEPITGTLTGVVVREDTGEPIRGVRIAIGKGNANALALESSAQVALLKNDANASAQASLLQATANSLAGSDSGRDFLTFTDNEGRFIVEGILPGEVPVTAQREGFVGTDVTQTPAVSRVTATVVSRKSTEIALKMIPGAVVSGRILNPAGVPAANALVEVLRRVDDAGGSSLQLVVARITDDRGDFRAFQLRPGEYFLSAKPSSTADTTSRTYYPGTSEVTEATSITLRSGEDLAAINIQMRNIVVEKDSRRSN